MFRLQENLIVNSIRFNLIQLFIVIIPIYVRNCKKLFRSLEINATHIVFLSYSPNLILIEHKHHIFKSDLTIIESTKTTSSTDVYISIESVGSCNVHIQKLV